MLLKKNIKLGKINFYPIIIVLLYVFFIPLSVKSEVTLEGNFTDIKVLDKISSKNVLIKLKNGDEVIHKDLLIKSMKCKNAEFDDNPEVTAYIQVSDLTNKKKDKVFVFNNWMFSSSPSIVPFDHPVYDIWLVSCY